MKDDEYSIRIESRDWGTCALCGNWLIRYGENGRSVCESCSEVTP